MRTCGVRVFSSASALMAACAMLAIPTAQGTAMNGGTTIATAVDIGAGLTTEATTAVGLGVEFYKATVGVGDVLTVGYGLQDGFDDPWVGACLLPPGTTDFTVSRSGCIHDFNRKTGDPTTRSKVQYSYRLPTGGTYVLVVGHATCVLGFGYLTVPCKYTAYSPSHPADPVPYVLQANIAYKTSLKMTSPKKVKSGTVVKVTGRLIGRLTAGAKIVLQINRSGQWRPVGSAKAASNGTYSINAIAPKPGSWSIRAIYRGDIHHQPSNAVGSIQAR